MKLARIGSPGSEVPAVAVGDDWRDLTTVVGDLDGSSLSSEGLAAIRTAIDTEQLPIITDTVRFGAPLARIGKIVCIGLNYRDHAAETGAAIPAEPIVFMKAPDTVGGATDDVLIPRASAQTDWEVELAIVIGAQAAYLASPDDAPAVIAGYAISNDVSEREFQLERGGQWDKGKNCATFNPLGPWILTSDEVADPQDLALTLSVNGTLMQDGTTADMIFDVNYIVWYLSQFMTLYPGDIINTGTPAGVALGSDERDFLKAGDVVELQISGLGRQRQTFRDA